MRVLLVEPDLQLQSKLRTILSNHHFVVDVATDGEEAWGLLQIYAYELILLEAQLPARLHGPSLCQRLRKVGYPALILLIIELTDKAMCIRGLDDGADACLTKPIEETDLLAQLRALVRRGKSRPSSCLVWGPLSLDPLAQQVTCDGKPLKLNRKEYQFLDLFLNHPRQMFSRQDLGERLWTLDEHLPTDATIKSHIRSLRRKLEQVGIQDMIQTHYGQGYRFNPVYAPTHQSARDRPPDTELRMDSITADIWQELLTANARLQEEIEERQQIEIQLRRSETMLRTAQRVALIGCWEFDLRTKEIYWTEELFLIHGLDPSQPLPSNEELLRLIHPDDRQHHKEAIYDPVLRGESFETNLRIIRADTQEIRYINARGGPIMDSTGAMIKLTGTTFDITPWVKPDLF